MKPWLSFALLALFAGIAFAQGFNHTAFAGTPSVSLANFTHNDEPAQALLSEGEVFAVFLPKNSTLLLTTDEILLADALRSYYLSRSHSLSSLSSLSGIHEGIASIRNSRLSGEGKCRILIGTDRNPCTDFFTCQQACYSVTSFCLPVALGSGRVFVNEVWLFENRSRELSDAYAEEEAAYSQLSANATRASLERYMSSLSGINRAATSAAESALYDAYSYCALPDYSLTQITSLQLDARRIQQNASKLLYLEEEAASVRSRTLLGLERLAMSNQPGATDQQGESQGQQPANASAQAHSPEPMQGKNASGIWQPQEGIPQASLETQQAIPDTSRRSVVLIAVAAVLLSTAVLALAAGSRHKERQHHGKK